MRSCLKLATTLPPFPSHPLKTQPETHLVLLLRARTPFDLLVQVHVTTLVLIDPFDLSYPVHVLQGLNERMEG